MKRRAWYQSIWNLSGTAPCFPPCAAGMIEQWGPLSDGAHHAGRGVSNTDMILKFQELRGTVWVAADGGNDEMQCLRS